MKIKGHPIENDLKGNLLGLTSAVTCMVGLGSLLMGALAAAEDYETDAWWWGSAGMLLAALSAWSWIGWRRRYVELSRLAEQGATFDDPMTTRIRRINESLARQTIPVVGVLLVVAAVFGLVTGDWRTFWVAAVVGGASSLFALAQDRRSRQ